MLKVYQNSFCRKVWGADYFFFKVKAVLSKIFITRYSKQMKVTFDVIYLPHCLKSVKSLLIII